MKKILLLTALVITSFAEAQNLPLSAGAAYPLSGALYHSGNGYTRRAFTSTYFGYGSSYRVLMLGSASTSYTTQDEGAVTLSLGYDPSGNTNGSFTGDGHELLLRNGVAFTTPNAANTSYYLNALVLKDGKVGLGTASPAASLELASGRVFVPDGSQSNPVVSFSSGTDVGLYRAGSGLLGLSGRLRLDDGSGAMPVIGFQGEGGLGMYRSAPGSLSFVTSSRESLSINAQGNVGIGTVYPESKLHVENGNVNNVGSRNNLGIYLSGGGYEGNVQQIGFGYGSGSLANVPAAMGHVVTTQSGYTSGALFFATRGETTDVAPTERMRITAEGKVGIGTISPSEKLSVNGNIKTKKLIVTQTNWPDYVFHPTYQLQPLSEVSRFIETNKHLPGMPSAKEVEKKGLDVGDTQALLLKKIEELTLYVIDLKKENEKQQAQINRLQKKK